MGTSPLVGSPYGSNSYEEFTINFADEVVNSFVSQHSFEPSVGFNAILTHDNVGSTSSGGRGRSGSISGHSAMTVQGVVRAAVLASDELVQLLRGNPSIEPTPVSTSGKKLGGVLAVIARASYNWKTGKSGIIEEGKGEATDKKDGEVIDGVLESFGDRCKGLFGVDKSTIGLLGGSGNNCIKATFFFNHFSSTHSTTYSVSNFVVKDADLLDVSFLTLLRSSRDGFISVRPISCCCIAFLVLIILFRPYSDWSLAQVLQQNVTRGTTTSLSSLKSWFVVCAISPLSCFARRTPVVLKPRARRLVARTPRMRQPLRQGLLEDHFPSRMMS
jgi:hypothetical protein